jgi:uncharacterized protein (DUF1697 family)
MPAIVSLLRGVNVGGHAQIKMDALREMYSALRLRSVQSYVQSGNLVFASPETDLRKLAKRIEDRIESDFGFRPDVILRTTAEMKAVIAANPFAERERIEPSRLLVTFLGREPLADGRQKVLEIPPGPEELHVRDRELYTYFPNGMARPKLSMAQVERFLKVPCTGRNWNTVRKLLEMAKAIEA